MRLAVRVLGYEVLAVEAGQDEGLRDLAGVMRDVLAGVLAPPPAADASLNWQATD